MIKVSVTNSKGMSFEGKFATQSLADEWVSAQVQENSWGLPNRWVRPFAGEPEEGYTQIRQVELNGETVNEYFYPVQYTITQEDISAQFLLEQQEKEVQDAIVKGQKVERLISAYLRDRLAKGEITLAELAAFVESDAVKTVERYLSKGYLEMVKPIIQSQAYSLVTDAKKAEFLALL